MKMVPLSNIEAEDSACHDFSVLTQSLTPLYHGSMSVIHMTFVLNLSRADRAC